MKTKSILLQNLFVPCACRCRYCLLAWNGASFGVPWERSCGFALRFKEWQLAERPELKFDFSFGSSMEHPDITGALRFLKSVGSPQAEFWQCGGMKMRSEAECAALMQTLAAEGMKHLNFTFYGLEEYHDRFAARRGDFALLLRMLRAAVSAGLETSAGIPLTRESAPMADELFGLLKESGCGRVFLFVPHEEGRGTALNRVRFSESDIEKLSPDTFALLNGNIFRPEREWVSGSFFVPETERTLLISLRADNIERYEAMEPGELVAEVEALDDAYYAAFPTLPELAERYGDRNGTLYYRQRDLFYHYRRMYAEEFGVRVYDVTDERQSGSRRY